jgi:hypothetical protein
MMCQPTTLEQTKNAHLVQPQAPRAMDELRMKKSTWMELCKVFQLDLDKPRFTLLDTVLDEWQWNPSLFKDSATLFRHTSIPLTSIQQMSNELTASNTQDGSHPSETAPDESTIPRKPPGLLMTRPQKGVWNYYLTATLLDAQFTFAS